MSSRNQAIVPAGGHIQEECGVFGLINRFGGAGPRDPAFHAYHAMYALQHRGQDSCGIAACIDGRLVLHKNQGLVPEVFTPEQLNRLSGACGAIGHVRHAPNASDGNPANAQPIVVRHASASMALCYNGKLVNSRALRREMENRGGIFQTTNDAEVITYLVVREHLRTNTLADAILNAMDYMIGAFSLVVMNDKELIAARDPNGFRPLCVGQVDGCYCFASESCAIEALGGTFLRDVEPGEVLVATGSDLHSYHSRIRVAKRSFCVFELVYFARQDSVIDGISIGKAREEAGRALARRNTVEADVVIGVPDSGIPAAMGFARESGLPYAMGLMKNRYIQRTFIQSQKLEREESLRIKLNAIHSVVCGKRIIMVDDSIVRGGTSARIVQLLREAGAKEVHVKVTAPPFLFPCDYGTAIPNAEQLAAHNRTQEEICQRIGADSLQYLSLEDVRHLAGDVGVCDACFTGNYVLPHSNSDENRQPM